jgi:hypothetical protein
MKTIQPKKAKFFKKEFCFWGITPKPKIGIL